MTTKEREKDNIEYRPTGIVVQKDGRYVFIPNETIPLKAIRLPYKDDTYTDD